MKNLQSENSISITETSDFLIVTLSGELNNMDIYTISDMIMTKSYKKNKHGVIFNFSMVTVIDSYMFNEFYKMTLSLKLIGTNTVWIGLRPGLVSALMDLNISYDENKIMSAISLEEGFEILYRLKR
ncbi:MAG: hypothetical protein H7A30_02955 [Thermotogae bacterium]|nr:hypothetical protein [Thermotogota bacterium]